MHGPAPSIASHRHGVMTSGAVLARERLLGAASRFADIHVDEQARRLTTRIAVSNGRPAGDAWYHGASLEIVLALAHPAAASVNGVLSSWPLAADGAGHTGALRDAAAWLTSELWGDDVVEQDTDTCHLYASDDLREHPSYRHARRRIQIVFDRIAERAIELCDRTARDLAMELPPDAHFFAYAALLSDPSGRVAQMIATCPALVCLGGSLAPDAGAALVDGIRAGTKLATLISGALATLALPVLPTTLALVRTAPGLPRDELAAVLRARGVDHNDVPAAGPARRAWYAAVAAWGRAARRLPDPTQVGGFVSRHALAFAGEHPVPAIEALVDWLERSGAPRPSRRSPPDRVQRAVKRWHDALCDLVEHTPETRLARAPTLSRHVPRLSSAPLETVGDLIVEGCSMRHCVASLADAAIGGTVFVYRASIDGVRATVAIARGPRGWRIQEAAGFANASLDPDQLALLEHWVDALR